MIMGITHEERLRQTGILFQEAMSCNPVETEALIAALFDGATCFRWATWTLTPAKLAAFRRMLMLIVMEARG